MLTHTHNALTRPSRVVVMGAGGFVGGAILARLKALDVPVLPVSRTDVDLLGEGGGAALAALLHPGDVLVAVSAKAPCKTPAMMEENMRMVAALCQVAAGSELAQVVNISSDAVYTDDAPLVSEFTPAAPASLHGTMHLAREIMLRGVCKAPLAVLRPSIIYGAADPHNGYGPNRFRRLAAEGKEITLFGEGEEKRDHVFVDDVAELVALTILHGSRGVLNLTSGESHSFRDVAEMAVRLAGSASTVKGTPRQNPITHRHFDVTVRLRAFPTFRATPLAEGMAKARRDMENN